jgi:predicted nucleic acid-binding protein
VIVVDASVLIAHLDESDAQHDRASEQLLDLAPQPLGASPITIAEVLVGPARHGRLDEAQRALRALELSEVPLGPGGASRLAVLRADTQLKLPDCCVLLAAEDARADRVLTFDDRLGSAAARMGL